jgi:primosomal protein N' (replication factor Y)
MRDFFAEILLPIPLNQAFVYKTNDKNISTGDVVKVEFRKKFLFGVVVKVASELESSLSIDKIKEIIFKNDDIKLKEKTIEFINWISSYNLVPSGLILKSFLGILNSDKAKNPTKTTKLVAESIDNSNFFLQKLSENQQKISDELCDRINGGGHFVALIDGVTGSGKTEIYFYLIKEILAKNNGQVLILLPEIALTSQLLSRFEKQFNFKPALWHSKISTKQKREIFYGIADGSLRVLIGARSALLLPYKNLKLIIIDEEHDSSFKQEDSFNFNARDMAIVNAKLENFPIILSSATPSLSSFHNAKLGKYLYFKLEEKFYEKKNIIKLIDLRKQRLSSEKFISDELKSALKKNLEDGKQSLLFLNKRGYAPVTLCRACGQKINCPNCSSYLVLHKNLKKMMCHYCGYLSGLTEDCKKCNTEKSLVNIGCGVEKIKEEIEKYFTEARICLVTSDNVLNFEDADSLVKKIFNQEIDIIIGTQLIAKGYDFPHLSLVGIVDSDSGFYSSELNATEKSYQLLNQVIGRAGRRKDAGKVFIQTYNPENFVFKKIISGDQSGFYNAEIKNREMLALPPFTRIASIVVSAFDENLAHNFAKKVIKKFPNDKFIDLFGPTEMPLLKIKNRYQYRVFVKVNKKINLQKLIFDVIRTLEIKGGIKVVVDVDPS